MRADQRPCSDRSRQATHSSLQLEWQLPELQFEWQFSTASLAILQLEWQLSELQFEWQFSTPRSANPGPT